MARSFNAMGYGMAAVIAAVLFAIGPPARREAALADQPSATAAAPPPASVSAAGVTLTSVSVDLPASDRLFPDGPGGDAINDNCLACHSAGMVLSQPGMSRAAWQAEVNKMRSQFKAPVDEGDIPAIVDYLVRTKGNG